MLGQGPPQCPHADLVISAKTLSPNKIVFTGTGGWDVTTPFGGRIQFNPWHQDTVSPSEASYKQGA